MHHPPGTPTGRLLPPNSPAAASPSHQNGGAGASAYSTALRGASLAFQKSSPRPTPKSSPGQPQRQQPARATSTKDDGNRDSEALIAATSASREHSLSRQSPTRTAAGNLSNQNTGRISRQATGSSSIAGDGNYGQENGQNHGAYNNSNQRPPQRSATPQKQQQQNTGGGAPSLRPPGLASMGPDPRSPSFIAATLAASRSASPSRREPPPQQQQLNPAQVTTNQPYAQQAATRAKRKDSAAEASRTSQSATSSVTDLDLTDTTPIPATNSLISMFEKKEDIPGEGHAEPVKKVLSRMPTRKATAKLHPITPPLAESPMPKSDISPSMVASTLAWGQVASPPASASGTKIEAAPASHADKLEGKKRPPTPPIKSRKSIGAASKASGPEEEGAKRKPRAATPPRPATANRSETAILSPRPRRAASHKMILQNDLGPEGKTDGQESTGNKALLDETLNPGPRPSSTKTLPAKTTRVVNKPQPRPPRPRRSSSTSSKDTFVSASSGTSPRSGSPRPGPSRAASPTSPITKPTRRTGSAQSLPARKPVPPPAPPRRGQAQQSNIPLTSLTNATMAGILASARASPSAGASTSSPAGPPAPPPPRKQTPPHAADAAAAAQVRGRGGQGQPGPAQEEAPPEQEEARASRGHNRRPSYYERNNSSSGSSAGGGTANPNPADFVANVVARDIWSRSRLPFDELAEVWDLVDSRGVGALDKTEFVVGMWLIDQRLRGRKIPHKVSESVWNSARGGHVRVPVPPSMADGKGGKHRKKK
ncbi:hypothetical protein PG984_002640 [Apiospora sp. TS-2023a]